MQIGWGELLVILAIVLVIAGGKRLPELGRSLGEAVREFQRGWRGTSERKDDNHTEQK